MNTINSSVHVAMEGQTNYSSNVRNKTSKEPEVPVSKMTPTGAQVAQNIEQSMAEIKADTQQLQKMSDLISGGKLQFSVNKDLKTVVVTVVDSNTNQVLKEIPSRDIQTLKLRIRKAIGNIFNEVI